MALTIVILLLFVLLAIGMPVGFAMAAVGAVGLMVLLGPGALLGVLQTAPLSAANSYELLTVPMFLLMAEFVLLSGLADRLFDTATKWVGHIRGGLAMGTAIAGAGFGAISGSSTASAAVLSSTTVPSMIERGYEPQFACGAVAISGTLAMLIPPSIALILYGLIADVNIGKLLIGGIIPGALVTLTIIITIAILVRLDPAVAPEVQKTGWKDRISSLTVIAPTLFLFFAVMGVIYTGIATPTEASAIGASGAFLLFLKEKGLNLPLLHKALLRAAQTTCMILVIILGAQIFGYYIALTHITQDMIAFIQASGLSRWSVLAAVLLLVVILGCFMDQIAILFLTVPVLVPLIVAYGFDPVWFGVIMIVTAELGMVTPPVGMNGFVVARYTGRPLTEIFRGVTPHIAAHVVIIFILAVLPGITLWLPNRM